MTAPAEFVDGDKESATSAEPRGLLSAVSAGVSTAEVIAANEQLHNAIARLERLEAIELEWLRDAVRVTRLAAEAFAEESREGNSGSA
jgi:hypothetical protein